MTDIIKILALDVGEKRIGTAVSDDLGVIATPLSTVQRSDLASDLAALEKLSAEQGAKKVVVGLPINMNGAYGSQARKVLDFIDALRGKLEIPVITWDERLSSRCARRPLEEAGMKRRKQKKVIDKLAAVIILQSYLDCKKHLDNPSAEAPNPYRK